jgi:hypothetical protein
MKNFLLFNFFVFSIIDFSTFEKSVCALVCCLIACCEEGNTCFALLGMKGNGKNGTKVPPVKTAVSKPVPIAVSPRKLDDRLQDPV